LGGAAGGGDGGGTSGCGGDGGDGGEAGGEGGWRNCMCISPLASAKLVLPEHRWSVCWTDEVVETVDVAEATVSVFTLIRLVYSWGA
jgi:hypothetical protein